MKAKILANQFLFYILIFLLPVVCQGYESRGIGVVKIKDDDGRSILLYKQSHALLIGVSDYTKGWPDLEAVPDELKEVESALSRHGFQVEKVVNPNSEQMRKAFQGFINRYGYDKDNRLLFFFSGHGYTRKKGKRGYLVPSDASDPRKDEKDFLRTAIDMGQILSWSRQMEAKHAIFLFDSCFSGTIFKTRALPDIPPHISSIASRPVRQFIAAGSAGEEIPARSVFTPIFVRALRGDGDLNKDGYVTGTELGMFLHDKVLAYDSGQTPQYGKIRDPDLDEGDLVFQIPGPKGSESAPPTGRPPSDYWWLAKDHSKLGQHKEAVESWKYFVERTSDETLRTTAYWWLAEDYGKLGQYREATESWKYFIEHTSDETLKTTAYWWIAKDYGKLGKHREATESWKYFIGNTPDESLKIAAYWWIAEEYEKLGQYEMAKKYWNSYIDTSKDKNLIETARQRLIKLESKSR